MKDSASSTAASRKGAPSSHMSPMMNGQRKHLREQQRADHAVDRAHAAQCALQLALFSGTDAMTHHGLERWIGDAPEGHERQPGQEQSTRGRQAKYQEPQDAAGQSGERRTAFAQYPEPQA